MKASVKTKPKIVAKPPAPKTAPKRDVMTDLKDRVIEDEFIGSLPEPKINKKPKVTVPPAKAFSRGAVVKVDPKKVADAAKKAVAAIAGTTKKAVITARTPYRPDAKITVIEGARSYRQPGKVYDAVQLMKKHGTVKAYEDAMAKSNNDLPATGLLRFLHKKQAVSVEE